jgi:hypothetical protein
MKIQRSARCSLKFATASKRETLKTVLAEYGRVVNCFIDLFWEDVPGRSALLKPVVDSIPSWLSARLRKVAAWEAIGMVKSIKAKKRPGETKPVHRGNRMCCCSTIVNLIPAQSATEFDAWIHLWCIGNKIILDLPIKFHKQFNKWNELGTRLNSYIITSDYIQFCFEVETGPKKSPDTMIGVDTGIKTLAACSDGRMLGRDIEAPIQRIKRCKHGSKGQKRASNALRQRMDEVAKEVVASVDLVVVEKLKKLADKTKIKRRLSKAVRYTIGRWNYRYWLTRLQQKCEENRVSFRSVPAYNTSRQCPSCGHTDRGNRRGEEFICLLCGYADNADHNASLNILNRFLTGAYGPGFKLALEICL